MQFLLGTHETSWLSKTDIPLFISHRRLAMRRALPRAHCRWALDSGGFSELSLYGEWRTSTQVYLDAVDRYEREIGNLLWAAPQDWMCEPWLIGRTGLTVLEHQRRTISNFLELRNAQGGFTFIPVLQGWSLDDYLRHIDMYGAAGVDFRYEPLVGVGSVCRRQATGPIEVIMETLACLGLRLHGFGVKLAGLDRYADCLVSADSLAWSYNARRTPALPGCAHKSCANCLKWATRWRARVVARLQTTQMRLVYA